jgi:hypothetical protein
MDSGFDSAGRESGDVGIPFDDGTIGSCNAQFRRIEALEKRDVAVESRRSIIFFNPRQLLLDVGDGLTETWDGDNEHKHYGETEPAHPFLCRGHS